MEESKKRSAPENNVCDIIPCQTSTKRQVLTESTASATDPRTAAILNASVAAVSYDSSDEGSTTASESVPQRGEQRHTVWLKPRERREPRVGEDFQAEVPEVEG